MRFAVCRLSGRTGHAAGRELLAELYREETGEALPPIRISKTGCPYFPGSPYCFSIAHTARHAACFHGNARTDLHTALFGEHPQNVRSVLVKLTSHKNRSSF